MSDDSEYDSEDDEDYIPEEPSSGEEAGVVDGSNKNKGKGKKQENRKRKGGIQLEEDDEVSGNEESDNEVDNADTETPAKEDLALKQKVDDLWEAFKQDTAAIRPAALSSTTQKTEKKIEEKPSTSSGKKNEEVPKKVEVTEIFDFAGEEVKVIKSVDSSSIKPAPVGDRDNTSLKPKAALPTKRPGGGLGSVLGKIGKKPKLSTLEKSKLDWNSFKKDEGIEDELKTSNRDGFLEKQAFLNRVDHKQFEIERDIRQGFRKK